MAKALSTASRADLALVAQALEDAVVVVVVVGNWDAFARACDFSCAPDSSGSAPDSSGSAQGKNSGNSPKKRRTKLCGKDVFKKFKEHAGLASGTQMTSKVPFEDVVAFIIETKRSAKAKPKAIPQSQNNCMLQVNGKQRKFDWKPSLWGGLASAPIKDVMPMDVDCNKAAGETASLDATPNLVLQADPAPSPEPEFPLSPKSPANLDEIRRAGRAVQVDSPQREGNKVFDSTPDRWLEGDGSRRPSGAEQVWMPTPTAMQDMAYTYAAAKEDAQYSLNYCLNGPWAAGADATALDLGGGIVAFRYVPPAQAFTPGCYYMPQCV